MFYCAYFYAHLIDFRYKIEYLIIFFNLKNYTNGVADKHIY